MISTYENQTAQLEETQYQNLLEEARQYNQKLVKEQERLKDPFNREQDTDKRVQYYQLLSTDDSGIMGYIDIPKINAALPIYHGTASDVLERGVGHLEGTSLPIGGTDTHAVLTGHTGLGQAKLLSDLNELEKEDVFYVCVMGERLCYQVFDIETVLPEDTDGLRVIKGEDIVTLVTCTPYGVNTHRLLVHGRRIDEKQTNLSENVDAAESTSDSKWEQRYKQAMIIGAILILCMFFLFSQDTFRIIGICLLVAGTLVFISPELMQVIQKARVQELLQTYEQSEESQNRARDDSGLYRKMSVYNQQIYSENQQGLTMPEDNDAASDETEGFEEEILGILEIPAMDQILPIYAGATTEHMAKGAAVMENTSLPIGGIDTNCVIAGHRGYNRSKTFFKDIEFLSVGDKVYIKNLWEKLTYEVESIDIVNPDDIDAIKIQPGKDMVTLLTCHPYGSHGQYRYLVYCRRCQDNQSEDSTGRTEIKARVLKDEIAASDGKVYASSYRIIQKEKFFRWLCAGVLILLMVITEMKDIWRRRRSK